MIRYARFDSPLGPMVALARDGALAALFFEGARHAPDRAADWAERPGDPLLRLCMRQVAEYFRGTRRAFDLPLAPLGTPFQQRVWREIARIPSGETLSYAELARRAGAPGSARAAGAATGRNPWCLVVPCHRVVGSGGSLTGYAGGLARKTRLLALEGAAARAA